MDLSVLLVRDYAGHGPRMRNLTIRMVRSAAGILHVACRMFLAASVARRDSEPSCGHARSVNAEEEDEADVVEGFAKGDTVHVTLHGCARIFLVSFARLPLCERPDIGNFTALVGPGIDRPEFVGLAILDHCRIVRTLSE